MWTKSTLSVHRLYSKCPPLAWTHARCLPHHWSVASSKSDCSRPDETSMSRRFNSSTLWICLSIVGIIDNLSVVATMLHDSPDLVIHSTEISAVSRPQIWLKKYWRFSTQQFNCCTCVARCVGSLSCWNIKSLPDTLRIAGSIMTSWSSVEEVSKSYHQNFLLYTYTHTHLIKAKGHKATNMPS